MEITLLPSVTLEPLSLRLFGEVRLCANDVDATPRGRKARGLIAFVAVAPQAAVSRARIADLLWSDRGEEQARGSLRQVLAELRDGVLGDGALVVTRDTVGLRLGAVVSDLDEACAAARRGDIPALAASIGAISDVFAANLDDLSPGFDEWLRGERVRQTDRIVTLALEAAAAALGEADTVHIHAILSGLERLDPGNEHVARLGLAADHAAGDTASLHRRYRRLVDQLRDDFDSRPSEETRVLFHRLTSIAPVAPAATDEARAVPSTVEPPFVLVSPLVAIDSSPESASIAAICTDDIRVALAQHRDLRVVALESVDLERIESVAAGALASYMLSGKLRRVGTAIRLNIQLGNAATGMVAWSEQLRIDEGELADAIDHMVMRAAGAVVPAIERDLAVRMRALPINSSAADVVTTFAQARRLVRDMQGLVQLRAGADLLIQVIERDPRHVGARVLLAQLYNSDFRHMMAGHDVDELRTRAVALAREAASIEPDNVRVQLRLAWCHLKRREWSLAERGFDRASALLPFDADGLNEVAFGLCHLGDLARAEPIMQRAFAINPFPPADYHADHAVLLALRGDHDLAEEHFEVCGEAGLMYQALRLANRARLPAGAARTAELAATFVHAFAAIWQPVELPTIDDMLYWIDRCFTVRRDEHRRFVADGLRASLQTGH